MWGGGQPVWQLGPLWHPPWFGAALVYGHQPLDPWSPWGDWSLLAEGRDKEIAVPTHSKPRSPATRQPLCVRWPEGRSGSPWHPPWPSTAHILHYLPLAPHSLSGDQSLLAAGRDQEVGQQAPIGQPGPVHWEILLHWTCTPWWSVIIIVTGHSTIWSICVLCLYLYVCVCV